MILPPPPNSGREEKTAPDSAPGVPGFSTWRGVYIFVFLIFISVVSVLAWFARFFA
jgi:hypothetical protein